MTPEREETRSKTISWLVRHAAPADAASIAWVHVQSWRSTYRGLLPDDFLDALSVKDREQMWRRNLEAIAAERSSSCLLIAEAEAGKIVGFASAGPEREKGSPFEGELYALYLLREHQGKGAGRSLLLAAARHLEGTGRRSMRVWVLKGNPAVAFYESLGGIPAGEKSISIAGKEHVEVAYGWKDLVGLTANPVTSLDQ
jgi:ribosomal protein S18 acetylase RimI-like enzyme